VDSRIAPTVKHTFTDAMALVSWSRVRASLVDEACEAVRWRCRRLALVDSRIAPTVKHTFTDAMALVSWSRVRASLVDDLGCTGTHEAVVVAVNQRPNLIGVLGFN
jgi:hypothetical protein